MPDLILDGRAYTWAWVRAQGARAAETADSNYARHTLSFCAGWLNDQAAFRLPTSGSTGAPKPVSLTRRQMSASARATGQALGLRAGERALVCLNPAYIAGAMMLVRGLELGLQLTVIPPTGRPLAEFSAETAFDFTAFVPLQLQNSLAFPHDTALLNRLRAVLIGGAPLSPALARQARAVSAPLYHTYGMTETVSHIALRRLNGEDSAETFTPLPGVECRLDARGCLLVRGPMTDDAWVTTNDRVELTPDGRLRWLGRLDRVINSGGVKVQAEKVERALQTLLPDRRLLVVGRPDPRLGECVAAVIEGAPLDLAALHAQLSPALTPYEMPRHLWAWPHLPETPTGKIDRLAVLAALGLPPPQPAAPAAPLEEPNPPLNPA